MCILRGAQCLVLIEIIVYATYSLCSEIQPGRNIQFYKPNSLALAVLGLYSSAKDLPRINLKNAAFLPDEEKKSEKQWIVTALLSFWRKSAFGAKSENE